MIRLIVDAEYNDAHVYYVRDAPALPAGMFWHRGMYFTDTFPDETGGFEVDSVYVNHLGEGEVYFFERHHSNRTDENDLMFTECGWKIEDTEH